MGLPVSNAKLVMWLFLATEIMFFMGLIGTYIALRFGRADWPTQEVAGLNVNVGAFNTLVLILSSVTVVLALSATGRGDRRQQGLYLAITASLGLTFMVVKAFEYQAKYKHEIFQVVNGRPVLAPKDSVHLFEFDPKQELANLENGIVSEGLRQVFGRSGIPLATGATVAVVEKGNSWVLRNQDAQYSLHKEETKERNEAKTIASVHGPLPGGGLWPSLYFTLTGFHGLHVIGGVVMLAMLWVQSVAGRLGPNRYERVKLIGLYWHFVDIVWIFLFPLLYMIG